MGRRPYLRKTRAATCAALLASVACNSKSKLPVPAHGSASDPWAAPAGSAYDPLAGSDVPAWAHDSPTVLREKINGVNADVIVLKSSDLTEYRDVLAAAEKTPGVIAAEPFDFVEGEIASGSGARHALALKGADPARAARVLTIGKHMVTGSVAALSTGDPPPIVLGDTLAAQLGVHLGDAVTVTLAPPPPTAFDDILDPSPLGSAKPPRTATFRVAGTFHMGFDEYDGKLALASLAAVQLLVGRGDQVMGVEMIVKDVEHPDAVVKALDATLGGPPYQVMDWYELNKQLYTAMFGDKRP